VHGKNDLSSKSNSSIHNGHSSTPADVFESIILFRSCVNYWIGRNFMIFTFYVVFVNKNFQLMVDADS